MSLYDDLAILQSYIDNAKLYPKFSIKYTNHKDYVEIDLDLEKENSDKKFEIVELYSEEELEDLKKSRFYLK